MWDLWILYDIGTVKQKRCVCPFNCFLVLFYISLYDSIIVGSVSFRCGIVAVPFTQNEKNVDEERPIFRQIGGDVDERQK